MASGDNKPFDRVGHGVKVLLTELADPVRSRGSNPGAFLTSIERAIKKGLVVLEDGRFTLTSHGRQTYEAMESQDPWWKTDEGVRAKIAKHVNLKDK